jgi:hypothetical protein
MDCDASFLSAGSLLMLTPGSGAADVAIGPSLIGSTHAHATQVAYLASTLFLDSSSDLIVLIVNTITRDLADDNMLIGAHAPLCM